MTEFIFQKGLTLIKQICQKSVIFATIGKYQEINAETYLKKKKIKKENMQKIEIAICLKKSKKD